MTPGWRGVEEVKKVASARSSKWVCAFARCDGMSALLSLHFLVHQGTRHAPVKTFRAFACLYRMSNGSPGPGSASILHRVGLAGALARFCQRSYAADYIALGFLALGWVMVSWTYLLYYMVACANGRSFSEQIQFMNPFHRMFALDNKAIMYPFAVHERVPVCTAPSRHPQLQYTDVMISMVRDLRWRDPIPDHHGLVRHDAPRGAKDSSDGTGAIGCIDVDFFPD